MAKGKKKVGIPALMIFIIVLSVGLFIFSLQNDGIETEQSIIGSGSSDVLAELDALEEEDLSFNEFEELTEDFA